MRRGRGHHIATLYTADAVRVGPSSTRTSATHSFELADPLELEVVLGHEVGHIMSEHALYRTLLFLLLAMSTRVRKVWDDA